MKWVEAAGARVAIIPYDAPKQQIDQLLSSVNAVLFTGGELVRETTVAYRAVFSFAPLANWWCLFVAEASCIGSKENTPNGKRLIFTLMLTLRFPRRQALELDTPYMQQANYIFQTVKAREMHAGPPSRICWRTLMHRCVAGSGCVRVRGGGMFVPPIPPNRWRQVPVC